MHRSGVNIYCVGNVRYRTTYTAIRHPCNHGRERSDVEYWRPLAEAVATDNVFPH